MRILPILTALVVAAAIFVFVFQRDLILPAGDDVETSETTSDVTPASTDEKAADEPKLVSVVVIDSNAQSLTSRVLVRGETEAARQVNLLAETSGAVISPPLRKGTFVKSGQAMCELDPGTRDAGLAEAQARLAEARAQVPAAEANLAQAKARLVEVSIEENAAAKLKTSGFASQARVAAAQASMGAAEAGIRSAESGIESAIAAIQSAEAGVASAAKEIDRLVITASFDGILESDTAELGSVLQPGALCATVIQLDPIKLVGFVPEVDINRVNIGALAGARLLDGSEVAGKVSFISRSADSTTRTFRIEITVPNEDLKIRDGQSADIAIAAEGTMSHLVPGSALTLNDQGLLGLRLVDEANIVQFAPVSVARDTVEGMWVDGLPAKARVIVVGQEFVKAGVEVEAHLKGASK